MPNNDDSFYDGYNDHHKQIINGYKHKPKPPKWGIVEWVLVGLIVFSAISLAIGYYKM